MRAAVTRAASAPALISVAALAAGCGSGAAGASPGMSRPASASPGVASTAPAHRQAVPALSLHFPARLAAGELNPVGFRVDNPGAAQTVTVHLQVRGLTALTPMAKAPDEKVVVQHHDPASGSWSALPVHYVTLPSGGFADVAAYQLSLPAQASVTEKLRLIPAGAQTTTIHVSLSGPSFATVAHTATLPLVTPALTVSGPSSVAPGSTPEFDFTLTNTTNADYTDVNLGVMAYGSTPNCATSPFPAAQWSDGGAWHSTSATDLASPVATISVNAGQSMQIRLKLDVPANLPNCLTRGQVEVAIWLPGPGSFVLQSPQQERPGFSVGRGSPFFSFR